MLTRGAEARTDVIYRFENFEVHADLCELRRDDELVPMEPKVLDLLIYLVRFRERLVSREELFEALWPDSAVGEHVLSQAIYRLRRTLGDDARHPRIIETASRHGFRFIADVEAIGASTADAKVSTEAPSAEPFVGRMEVLGELGDALDHACTQKGGVILVTGEAGVGKSRTVDELARLARGRTIQAVTGWCYEGAGAPAYWPWVRALRDLIEPRDAKQLRAELGHGAADLAELVPTLLDKLGSLPMLPKLAPEQGRFRFFDNTVRFLKAASQAQPMLLIFEDLHWADPASLLLLEFLAHEIAQARILVVASYRPEEVRGDSPISDLLGRIVARPDCQQIALAGFSTEETIDFVTQTTGVAPSYHWAATITERTAGNPFLLKQVLRLFERGGELQQAEDFAGLETAIPLGVQDVIATGISRLSPSASELLNLCAVIGQEFPLELLRRAWPGEEPLDLACVDESLRAHLLQEFPDGSRLRFAHDLIRESIYGRLGTAQRLRLHRSVGEALESLGNTQSVQDLAGLAHHFFQAAQDGRDLEKTASYLLRAGERAMQGFAFEDAASHYQRALQIFSIQEEVCEKQRCETLLALGNAQRMAGDEAGFRESISSAIETARHTGQPDLLAQAAFDATVLMGWKPGFIDHAQIRLLEEALAVQPADDPRSRSLLLTRLAIHLYWSDEAERCERTAQEAVEQAKRRGDPKALTYALSAHYLSLYRPERTADRATVGARLVGRLTGVPGIDSWCQQVRVVEALEAGERQDILAELRSLEELYEELRWPRQLWTLEMAKGMWALVEGRLEAADAYFRDARAIGARLHEDAFGTVFDSQEVLLAFERGIGVEELSFLEPVLRELAVQNPGIRTWECALAYVYSQAGEVQRAQETVERIAAKEFRDLGNDLSWFMSTAFLAEACTQLVDVPRSALLYEQMLPHEKRHVSLWSSGYFGPIAHRLGCLARTLSNHDAATQHFETSLAMTRNLGARPWYARSEFEYARTLVELGKNREARTRLESALHSAEEMGMHQLTEQARRAIQTI